SIGCPACLDQRPGNEGWSAAIQRDRFADHQRNKRETASARRSVSIARRSRSDTNARAALAGTNSYQLRGCRSDQTAQSDDSALPWTSATTLAQPDRAPERSPLSSESIRPFLERLHY